MENMKLLMKQNIKEGESSIGVSWITYGTRSKDTYYLSIINPFSKKFRTYIDQTTFSTHHSYTYIVHNFIWRRSIKMFTTMSIIIPESSIKL